MERRWREDGWTVELIELTCVTPGDADHELWLRPCHDGAWLRVTEPNGYLAGYVDSLAGLRRHFPRLVKCAAAVENLQHWAATRA